MVLKFRKWLFNFKIDNTKLHIDNYIQFIFILRKKNLLIFFIVDDLSYKYLGVYGSAFYENPIQNSKKEIE